MGWKAAADRCRLQTQALPAHQCDGDMLNGRLSHRAPISWQHITLACSLAMDSRGWLQLPEGPTGQAQAVVVRLQGFCRQVAAEPGVLADLGHSDPPAGVRVQHAQQQVLPLLGDQIFPLRPSRDAAAHSCVTLRLLLW